jgi:hypothetical protein
MRMAILARALGAIVLTAMFVQLRKTLADGNSLVNFFSFFTIESNLFAAFVLLFQPKNTPMRGAATLYMTVVGLVYVTLLAGGDHLLIPWVNVVFHYAAPAAILLLWLIVPRPLAADTRALVPAWLAFPICFAAYSLIRGAYTGWYPYAFLDSRIVGVNGVIAAIAGIAIGTALVALGLIAYAKRRG